MHDRGRPRAACEFIGCLLASIFISTQMVRVLWVMSAKVGGVKMVGLVNIVTSYFPLNNVMLM